MTTNSVQTGIGPVDGLGLYPITTGYVLGNTSGIDAYPYPIAVAAIPITLTVGSTAIASGTTTRLLYDNAGVLGEALLRYSAGNLFLGGVDAASPAAQTLSMQNVVAGTANTVGANFTLKGSAGTGTGVGGSLIFQTTSAGSSGSSQNAHTTALTINGKQQVLVSDGTAAEPGLSFASTPTLGFYLAGANRLGIAANGLAVAQFFNQNVLGTNDGMVLQLGRAQTFSGAGEAYPVGITIAGQTVSGATAAVGFFLGGFSMTASDQVQKTALSLGTEIEKMDIFQATGQPITWDQATTLRIWGSPIPHTGVTLTNGYGLTWTMPRASNVTGAVTNITLMHFPAVPGDAAPSTWRGMRFDGAYNGHHITTLATVDLDLHSAAGMGLTTSGGAMTLTSSAAIILNAATGSSINLQNNSKTLLQINNVGAGNNFFTMAANNTPSLAVNSVAGAGMAISAKAGNITFYTTSEQVGQQFAIINVASVANSVTVTGGTAGNSATIASAGEANAGLTISTAGTGVLSLRQNGVNKLDYGGTAVGVWTLAAPIVTAASGTSAAGFRLPHGAAPSAPIDGDMWTTTTGLFVRINGATVGPLT